MKKAANPPVPGQIVSDIERGVRVLRLWPADWVHNATWPEPPIATLWRPELCGIGHDNIVVMGLEAVQRGSSRRWSSQKWRCDVIDAQRARGYYKPRLIQGEMPSAMPPSPPPADPDNPFA